jgi:alanyl-tRNA synthetase
MEELIEFANNATYRVGGMLVALSGTDGDYKYVIASSSYDMRAEIKKINAALSGRGGGRPNMVQGAFLTDRATIVEYFSKKYK